MKLFGRPLSASATASTFDVGGVLMDRPFKIRRLGHFGLTFRHLDEAVRFYADLLGFWVSEQCDVAELAPTLVKPMLKAVKDRTIYMLRHNSDHHTLILVGKTINDIGERTIRGRNPVKGVTTNQITWQVGSLAEVVNGSAYFTDRGCRVLNTGRDMPGSNWHCYLEDPDRHTIEIYYGIEQVGWDGRSKPVALYDRGFSKAPKLPQMGEWQEIDNALREGVDLAAGFRAEDSRPTPYDVDGIAMARPFKITRIGPVALFVEDVSRALQFYIETMGFLETERRTHQGEEMVFLRNNTEHHSLVLIPIGLRKHLGLSDQTTLAWFGLQMASYRQLRAAISFLREHGVRVVDDLNPGLHPGIDRAAWAFDPDGHCLLLYWSMEQIGWDGKPRPTDEPAAPAWPDNVEETSASYRGEVFLGPHA
ncbi:VOC family protein [Bradyrhizobium sp. AZCC 1693]|uniref:VOC family protein n=1 Tax=Bradyrhizobium sp. AZCC 1693 TaxID=3117029 RepID=UPI002FF09335